MRKFGSNPLEVILRRAKASGNRKFLIYWNRGLGDIPLGLYSLVLKIRMEIPEAQITFLTRSNLSEGFALLGGVEVIVAPELKRGDPIAIDSFVDTARFDVVIESADPTHWVSWQIGTVVPHLTWKGEWDSLWERYQLDPTVDYVGVQVATEANYALWRDWPLDSWRRLIQRCTEAGKKVILFGYEKQSLFSGEGVIDLRGETSVLELLSVIKRCCKALVVPDSGISSMVYYLNEEFPLKHISLWSDPTVGILMQKVPSPNTQLEYIPILGENRDIATISVDQVYEQLSSSW